MFYDPTCKPEVKADPFTLESVIAWIEQQPALKAYDYYDCNGACLYSQYMLAHGFGAGVYFDGPYHDEWLDLHREPFFSIAKEGAHTFGAALQRARTALSSTSRDKNMSKFRDCPVENESPDPCPKCGATVSGKDAVNGVCQAGATWDRATAAERERCASIALAIDSGRGNEKEIARAIRSGK